MSFLGVCVCVFKSQLHFRTFQKSDQREQSDTHKKPKLVGHTHTSIEYIYIYIYTLVVGRVALMMVAEPRENASGAFCVLEAAEAARIVIKCAGYVSVCVCMGFMTMMMMGIGARCTLRVCVCDVRRARMFGHGTPHHHRNGAAMQLPTTPGRYITQQKAHKKRRNRRP